jgi:hypothetical protein
LLEKCSNLNVHAITVYDEKGEVNKAGDNSTQILHLCPISYFTDLFLSILSSRESGLRVVSPLGRVIFPQRHPNH